MPATPNLSHAFYFSVVQSVSQTAVLCVYIYIYESIPILFQDSELNELRKTIELLKKQNAAAQAAINGVINTPELNCKGKEKTPLLTLAQHSHDISPLDNI